MTLTGKFLIVLTLVLSVFFAGMAVAVFATHKNWEDRAKQLAADNRNLETKNEGLTLSINLLKESLAREKIARKLTLAALETEVASLRLRETALTNENAGLQATAGQLAQTSQTQSGLLVAATTQNEGLRTSLQTEMDRRDGVFAKFVSAIDDLHELQGQYNTVLSRNTTLAAMNAQYEDVMERLGPAAAEAQQLPPVVDGIVLAVGERNLIEISLGTDDALKVGHTLDVFRKGGVYLGRVVIKKTLPDRSVAEIIPDLRKGQIRIEDRVATRIVN